MSAPVFEDVDVDGVTATGPHPSATPQEQALLDWADANPIERPFIPKDGNGRYRAAPPQGGKEKGHTRVTTFAEALDDTAGLNTWRHRLLARGLVALDDRIALVRRGTEGNDDQLIDAAIAAALHHAGEKLKADLGTAFHTAMEHAVSGTGNRPPAPYQADVEATLKAMTLAGLTPSEYLEPTLYVPEYELIGHADVLATGPWGPSYRIVDYKTGSDCERLKYGIQQACYTHASHLWDGEQWIDVPEVDPSVAYLVHTPLGTGTCSVISVDTDLGWELAAMANEVRLKRRVATVRALFSPAVNSDTVAQLEATLAAAPAAASVEEADPPATASSTEPTHIADALTETLAAETPADTDRTAWIVERIKALKANHPELVDPLRARWLARCNDIARKPPWTDGEIDQLDALLHAIEPTFGDPDPARPTPTPAPDPEPAPLPPAALWEVDDDGTLATEEDVTAVRATIAQLRVDHLERFDTMKRWRDDAHREGRAWTSPAGLTVRQWHVARAALTCLRCCWDPKLDSAEGQTRAVLSIAIGEDLEPSWRTGAIFGSLTADQAEAVCTTANLFASADRATRAAVKTLVAAGA